MPELLAEFPEVFTWLITAPRGFWVTSWTQAILQYGRIRNRIMEDCVLYAQVIDPAGLDDRLLTLYERRVESNRRNAAELSACLLKLPEWYLRWLRRRGHTPAGVPSDLIGLSHTTDENVARKQMDRIKCCLGVK
jgi:hypothetical protein